MTKYLQGATKVPHKATKLFSYRVTDTVITQGESTSAFTELCMLHKLELEYNIGRTAGGAHV